MFNFQHRMEERGNLRREVFQENYQWHNVKNQVNLIKQRHSFETAAVFMKAGGVELTKESPPHPKNQEIRYHSYGELNGNVVHIVHSKENDRVNIISIFPANKKEIAELTAMREKLGSKLPEFSVEHSRELRSWVQLDAKQNLELYPTQRECEGKAKEARRAYVVEVGVPRNAMTKDQIVKYDNLREGAFREAAKSILNREAVQGKNHNEERQNLGKMNQQKVLEADKSKRDASRSL